MCSIWPRWTEYLNTHANALCNWASVTVEGDPNKVGMQSNKNSMEYKSCIEITEDLVSYTSYR